MKENLGIKTIDEYINCYSDEIKKILTKMRKIITKCDKDITERMSWGMPTFYLNENLVHFAVCKNHIGFYPGASGIEKFKERFDEYKYTKGAVQFPINKKIPYSLIKEITAFRVREAKSGK